MVLMRNRSAACRTGREGNGHNSGRRSLNITWVSTLSANEDNPDSLYSLCRMSEGDKGASGSKESCENGDGAASWSNSASTFFNVRRERCP